MDFTVTITDTSQLAGITAARNGYNADALLDPETMPRSIDTDAEYVQFVMGRAAQSYASQYGT